MKLQKSLKLAPMWLIACLLLVVESRTSGSGWLAILAAMLFSVFAVGFISPTWVVARTRRRMRKALSGGVAQVGEPVKLTLDVGRWMVVVAATEYGTEVCGRGVLQLPITPQHRGMIDSVKVRIMSATPIGVFWWVCDLTLQLDPPLLVGPEPIYKSATSNLAADPDPPMSIRPWRYGDNSRHILWAATARAGEPIVRADDMRLVPQQFEVVLSGSAAQVEDQARVWGGSLRQRLAEGQLVQVSVRHGQRRVWRPISGVDDINRALAIATPE